MSNYEVLDQPWLSGMQAALAEYMDGLIFGSDNPPIPVTGLPFCGCDSCYWREVAAFVIPRVLEAGKSGQVVLKEEL